MTDKAFTSAEVSAPRVVAALKDAIEWREAERVRLRQERIAEYSKPRKFFGLDVTLTADQATQKADKNLRELAGVNATYYWHGHHIREMKVLLALAIGAKDGKIRMSADDFQYVSNYYNDPAN
jgi:hypothetical protein